jgi:hypothetical protein
MVACFDGVTRREIQALRSGSAFAFAVECAQTDMV